MAQAGNVNCEATWKESWRLWPGRFHAPSIRLELSIVSCCLLILWIKLLGPLCSIDSLLLQPHCSRVITVMLRHPSHQTTSHRNTVLVIPCSTSGSRGLTQFIVVSASEINLTIASKMNVERWDTSIVRISELKLIQVGPFYHYCLFRESWHKHKLW